MYIIIIISPVHNVVVSTRDPVLAALGETLRKVVFAADSKENEKRCM